MYALSSFLGAFLLFYLELLAGQTLLPYYGGGSQVWTVCLVFFQGLLLGGYYYAHKVPPLFKKGGFPLFHCALALAAWALMPSAFPQSQWHKIPQADLALKLCWQLGLPFLLLSATATLMQTLFLHRADTPKENPYPLYAWSNIGSLAGLLGFPLGLEIVFSLEQNWLLWRLLFGVYCAVFIWIAFRRYDSPDSEPPAPPPPAKLRRLWFLLPAASGALLITATNHLALSTASISVMWMLPLAVYLLTFVLFFMETRHTKALIWTILSIIAVWAGVTWFKGGGLYRWLFFGINSVLACACLVAHGSLYRLKPEPKLLSSYYLHIAAGGFFGTLLLSFAIPFASRYIYVRAVDLVFALALLALCADYFLSLRWNVFRWKPLALLVTLPMLLYFNNSQLLEVHAVRNFYGLYRVIDVPDTKTRQLISGITLQGEQNFEAGQEDEPQTYYAHTGPAGKLFSIYNPPTVGLIGLGVGNLMPYARKNALWVYFELDPDVSDIAQNYFSHLSRHSEEARLVIGDGRKSLERVPDGFFGLLVIDAFSGGNIPMHLLTMEALSLYKSKISPDGAVLLHLSGNFFRLRQPAEQAAHGAGLLTAYSNMPSGDTPSQWLIATRNTGLLNSLYSAGWEKPLPHKTATPWMDGRKNILPVIRWGGYP